MKLSDFEPRDSEGFVSAGEPENPLYQTDYPPLPSIEDPDAVIATSSVEESLLPPTPLTPTLPPDDLRSFDHKRRKAVEFDSWVRRNSRWLFPLITVPLFALILEQMVSLMLFLDLNKRVYNHVPGECSFVPSIETGAVDVAWMDNRTLVVSTGSDLNNATNATRGGLLLWRIDGHDSFRLELRVGDRKKAKGRRVEPLNPYGISFTFDPKRGGIFAVVNVRVGRAPTDSVELLQLDGREAKWLKRLRRPVESAEFTSLRDVQLLGRGDRFFATNAFRSRRSALQVAEFTSDWWAGGSLLHFDGQTTRTVLRGLRTPTGLAWDAQRSLLFVSLMAADRIDVYRPRNGDERDLEKIEEIHVHSAPHFFTLEPGAAAFVVAAHPTKLRHLLFESSPYGYFAPSQVLRFRRAKNGHWKATQLYANDGATISGATVAVRLPDKRVAIGNAHNGLLRCGLTST
ncbi:hypothetical protein M3Y99_00944700 [Aphelenchoides fujianensis]|nr:hypothetical protein M3Y99_00944700 [Aphelenchoides fujianensis]